MTKSKIKSFEEVCKLVREHQLNGDKVVFCHGFFDILHRGHVTLLVEAKKLGEILIVGVDHDNNARQIKGPDRPINDHESRMFVLSNIEVVDYVFLIDQFKEKTSISDFFVDVYKILSPDILVTSIKAGENGELKRIQAEKSGVEFVDIKHGIYDKRTTYIIEKLGLD